MEYHFQSITTTYRLFNAVGIKPKVYVPILNEIQKWIKGSGPEWTINRLKALKTLYLQHYAGNLEFRLNHRSGIAVHKDGTPKGPFRALWSMGTARRTVNKVLLVLQYYTSGVNTGSPTYAQLIKFIAAVQSPRGYGHIPEWRIDSSILWCFHNAYRLSRYDSVEHWVSSGSKRTLVYSIGSTVRENSLSVDDHMRLFRSAIGNWHESHFPYLGQLINCASGHLYDLWVSPLTMIATDDYEPDVDLDEFFGLTTQPVIGSIGFIQERGFKLRAVANPLRIVQVLFSKLKNWLQEAQRTFLPWDKTFDQNAGIRWAQRKLSLGKRLHSIDLSNASDTIPLEDQLQLLRELTPPFLNKSELEEYNLSIQFLEKVCRFHWVIPASKDRREAQIRWVKGQPLGISVSFPLFAVTHGLRLAQLQDELGLRDSFVVLGDDVIVEDGLANAYLEFLDSVWGCDVSYDKTLSSNSVAEFASKIIIKKGTLRSFKYVEGDQVSIFSPYKPLDLLWRYGKVGMKLIPRKFRPVVQVMSCLPASKGGLGMIWKPDERISPDPIGYEWALIPEKADRFYSVAYNCKIRRNGSSYASYVVRRRSKTDRYRDLVVASLQDYGMSDAEVTWAFSHYAPIDAIRDGSATQDSAFLNPWNQWLVLHTNENLENKNYLFYEETVESVRASKVVIDDLRYEHSSSFTTYRHLRDKVVTWYKNLTSWAIDFWPKDKKS